MAQIMVITRVVYHPTSWPLRLRLLVLPQQQTWEEHRIAANTNPLWHRLPPVVESYRSLPGSSPVGQQQQQKQEHIRSVSRNRTVIVWPTAACRRMDVPVMTLHFRDFYILDKSKNESIITIDPVYRLHVTLAWNYCVRDDTVCSKANSSKLCIS